MMTGLHYTAATSKFAWFGGVTFSNANVRWQFTPKLTSDSCFAFLKGDLVPIACNNIKGFHFLCEAPSI
jgi:hypothetical protein